MQVYTYSEARQKFASILNKAEDMGKVLIKRKDGHIFALTPEKRDKSLLDVPFVQVDISAKSIVDIVRSGRKR